MASETMLFAGLPLVAILRGLTPEEAVPIGNVLVDAGFRMIEVPLNSPDPFKSIALLSDSVGDRALIGAGTVLRTTDVARVIDAGGKLIVMPHCDEAVIRAAKSEHAYCIPGVATVTEAFRALACGADALKMFPAEAMPPAIVKAWRAVISSKVALLPVGGITPASMREYRQAGASGFGLGSALFKPGMSINDIRTNAENFVTAWREL